MIKEFIANYDNILSAFRETFIMLGISVGVGIILGLVIGISISITGPNGLGPNKVVHQILGLGVNITRSIPFILLAIVLIPFTRFVIGRAFGTYAASIPLTIIATALFARFTEQSLSEVNPNIIKSGEVMGASKFQIIFHFMLKEAVSSLVLGFTSGIISVVSYSTVMGILGGGGIGDFAIYHGYTSNNRTLMFVVIIMMVIFVSVIQITGNIISNQLDKSRK